MTDAATFDLPEADDIQPQSGMDLLRANPSNNPFNLDPANPNLDDGQVLYHLAFGAKPEDFHPNLQPMAQHYAMAFQPQPPQSPGVLASADKVRTIANESATGSDATDAFNNKGEEDPTIPSHSAAPLDLDTTAPNLDIPVQSHLRSSQSILVGRTATSPQAETTSPNSHLNHNSPNRAVVVIGGGGDSFTHIGSEYADKHFPGSQYVGHFEWQFDRNGVMKRVQASAQNEPVVIIGHSWGAPAAFDMAKQIHANGGKVGMLVTADPVSSLPAGELPNDLPWVNITATPSNWDLGDWVAGAGGKPSQLPTQHAQLNGTVPVHHSDLPGMMKHPLNGGLSAEDMIARILGSSQGGQ